MKFRNQYLWTAFISVAVMASNLYAAGTRYKDRMFQVDVTDEPIVYAKDVPHLSAPHNVMSAVATFGGVIHLYANEVDETPVDLKMDIYRPSGDTETKRAAVIVSHGGALVAGERDDLSQYSVAYCDSLAARGFVAASISYRLGVTVKGDFPDPPASTNTVDLFMLMSAIMRDQYNLSIDSVDFARALYRGAQDLNAAVRYIRANADELGVDPDRIYLLGNSAGALLSINNIYANSSHDYPSYSYKEQKKNNKVVRPALGDLNKYGEQGVDAHANGGVFLWGAIHDPTLVGHNKTPVFLAHGLDDGTVLFKTGKALSKFNVVSKLTAMIPEEYSFISPALQEHVSLKVETPTLYGSFVIDSALSVNNGTKAKPKTLFVEDAGHEFYDESEAKEKEIRKKSFDFLYKLASSDPVVKAFAAVSVTKGKGDKLKAVIDGEYDGTDALKISEPIDVSSVTFDRTFSSNGFSTITLPFSISGQKITGAKQFLKFLKVAPNAEGVKEVQMKRAWCDYESVSQDIMEMDASGEEKQAALDACMAVSNTKIEANKPYIVQMKDDAHSLKFSVSSSNPVTLAKTPKKVEETVGNWVFRGTLASKTWEEDDPELTTNKAYGYTASAKGKIKEGEFVKIGKGSTIAALRSYLVWAPEKAASVAGLSKVLSNNPSTGLPENMNVVIVDGDENDAPHTTVIGELDTRSGEFKMLRNYDIKGRKLNGTPTARGAYYGKKVLGK